MQLAELFEGANKTLPGSEYHVPFVLVGCTTPRLAARSGPFVTHYNHPTTNSKTLLNGVMVFRKGNPGKFEADISFISSNRTAEVKDDSEGSPTSIRSVNYNPFSVLRRSSVKFVIVDGSPYSFLIRSGRTDYKMDLAENGSFWFGTSRYPLIQLTGWLLALGTGSTKKSNPVN